MGTPRTIRSAACSSPIKASDNASVSFCSTVLLSAGVIVATIHSSVRNGSELLAKSRSMMRPFVSFACHASAMCRVSRRDTELLRGLELTTKRVFISHLAFLENVFQPLFMCLNT